jgi:hypothetical protein
MPELIVHRKKKGKGFRTNKKTGNVFSLDRKKKIRFDTKVDSKPIPIVRSPNVTLSQRGFMKEGRFTNEFGIALAKNSLDNLEQNKAELMKQDPEKFKDSIEFFNKSITSLLANERLRNAGLPENQKKPDSQINVKTIVDNTNDEDRKRIQEITKNEKELQKFINGELSNAVAKAVGLNKEDLSFSEKQKVKNTIAFIEHSVSKEKEKPLTEEEKKKLEVTREGIALGKLGLFDDLPTVTQIGIMQDDPNLPNVLRNPRASMNFRVGSKAEQKVEFDQFLIKNADSIPELKGKTGRDLISAVEELKKEQNVKEEDVLTKLRNQKKLLNDRRKAIDNNEFEINPKLEKEIRLKAVDSQLTTQRNQLAKVDSDSSLQGEKDTRKEEIKNNITRLLKKKSDLEGFGDIFFISQNKKKLREKNNAELFKVESKIESIRKQVARQPSLSVFSGFVAKNIEVSRTARPKTALLSDLAQAKKSGDTKKISEINAKLEKIQEREEGNINRPSIGSAVFGFKQCSGCKGVGTTGQASKTCKTCLGSGSAKFGDALIFQASNQNPQQRGLFCRDCENRGFSSPACQKCKGRDPVTAKSQTKREAGKLMLEKERTMGIRKGSEKSTINPFGKLETMKDQSRLEKLPESSPFKPPTETSRPQVSDSGRLISKTDETRSPIKSNKEDLKKKNTQDLQNLLDK